MASASSKTRTDFFQPESKRLKPTITLICKGSTSQSHKDSDDAASTPNNGSPYSSILNVEQKSRIEYNKSLAKSKRNLKIRTEKDSNCKGGGGYVKLEELLVEETWLEALPGEFQKPYAQNPCKFVEREICSGTDPIYQPSHLIFNALNSTPFDRVKAVILGQSGSIKPILMQEKAGNNLLMLLSRQSHKRRKELYFYCGGTLLKRNLG